MKKILVLCIMCLLLCGCNNPTTRVNENNSIDCNKKDELLEKGAYLIDVRTEEEYEEYHLDNAINIPVDEILDGVMELNLNKDDLIIVYCRSGQRSIGAYRELKNYGYTNVYDLGAISKCEK